MKIQNQPLTQIEQAFAESNHYIVELYLAKRGLDLAEWYDVVIFRYLLSVQRWFRDTRLQKWKFNTIACQAIRSAISNEMRKQSHQIKTVSLDAELPREDGFTLMDTVTHENLNYLYIGGEEMQIRYNIKNVPERPERLGQKSDEIMAIETFINTSQKNMVFEYDTEDEAKKRLGTVRYYMKKKELDTMFEYYRVNDCVYIIRKETKKCR